MTMRTPSVLVGRPDFEKPSLPRIRLWDVLAAIDGHGILPAADPIARDPAGATGRPGPMG